MTALDDLAAKLREVAPTHPLDLLRERIGIFEAMYGHRPNALLVDATTLLLLRQAQLMDAGVVAADATTLREPPPFECVLGMRVVKVDGQLPSWEVALLPWSRV